MPKAARLSDVAALQRSKMLVLKYRARRVLVPRPLSYYDAMQSAYEHFPSLAGLPVRFLTDELEFLCGEATEVPENVWHEVESHVSVMTVRSGDDDEPGAGVTSHVGSAADARTLGSASRILVERASSVAGPSRQPLTTTDTDSAPRSILELSSSSPPKSTTRRRAIDAIPRPDFNISVPGPALVVDSPASTSRTTSAYYPPRHHPYPHVSMRKSNQSPKFTIKVRDIDGETLHFSVRPTSTVRKVLSACARRWGYNANDVSLHLEGRDDEFRECWQEDTMQSLDVVEADTFSIVALQ